MNGRPQQRHRPIMAEDRANNNNLSSALDIMYTCMFQLAGNTCWLRLQFHDFTARNATRPFRQSKNYRGRRKTSKNKWKIVKLNSPTLNIINIPTRLRSENIRAEKIVVEKQKTAPSSKIFSECVSKHMNRLEARNTRCSCLIQVDLNCEFCCDV